MATAMTDDTTLIGSKEAAELLGLTYATFKRRAKAGKIPRVAKMTGDTGAYLFDRSEIERLAAEAAA